MSKTILLGKFCPLHVGHISIINLARETSQELVVLVDNHNSFTMSLEDRVSVLERTFPGLDVRAIQEETYQDPSESKDFWPYWVGIIKKYVPEQIDTVIGSMTYVKDLAKHLDCKFIIIDVERLGVGISATKIKENLELNWDYLAPESKPYFMKNIALVGAESCGKSTITQKLAKHFKTHFVPEYGRTFVEHHGQDFNSNDLLHIAQTHMAHAKVLKTLARKVFLYDTEAIITHCWHDFFFKHDNPQIEYVINQQKIDLYILVPVQDTWVKDDVRYHAEKEARVLFYNKIKSELIKRNQNFIELKSQSWDDILQECINIIKEIL